MIKSALQGSCLEGKLGNPDSTSDRVHTRFHRFIGFCEGLVFGAVLVSL